jgi:DNA-binding Lrp family transcriptional regulator
VESAGVAGRLGQDLVSTVVFYKLALLNSTPVNDILFISVSISAKNLEGGKDMLKDILKILENDPRATDKQIATMVGVSAAEVNKIIKQAEKDRIILKYMTVVNWDKLEGSEQVWALIEVKVKPEPEGGFDSIAGRIALFEQVRSLYLASGTYDLLLVVVDKTEHKVADFVSQNLAHIEGVQGTETHFVLKRYKEDGENLEGGEGVKRQQVVL